MGADNWHTLVSRLFLPLRPTRIAKCKKSWYVEEIFHGFRANNKKSNDINSLPLTVKCITFSVGPHVTRSCYWTGDSFLHLRWHTNLKKKCVAFHLAQKLFLTCSKLSILITKQRISFTQTGSRASLSFVNVSVIFMRTTSSELTTKEHCLMNVSHKNITP